MTRLLLFVALLIPASANAYKVMRAQQTNKELRWTSLPMKFNIHSAPANGTTAAQTQAAVRAAYKTWSDVSCSYYKAQDLGVVNMPTGNGNDYVNTNVWRSAWPANLGQTALGVTQTKYDPYSGKILDADTHYNPNYNWAVDGSPWKSDVQAVATHEIGHQLGLDHSQYQDATMFYATGPGDTSQRSLHSDDIAGICHLYPTGSPAPPECSSPAHCAPNETCQNGKCVLASQKGYGGTCNSQKDCTSGICLQAGQNTFCSQMCDSAPCPGGDKCLPLQDGGKACLPGSANMGTKLLGQFCQSNMDCKSEICVSVPGKGYLCSQKCDLTQKNCPTGYWCAQSSIGGLCIPDDNTTPPPPPPPPPPKKKKKGLGEACTDSSDCESNICGYTPDGQVCVQLCDDANPCPGGFVCIPAGDKKACVKDKSTPPAPGTLGAACEKNEDCKSGVCGADAAGRRFCTELCDPGQGCAQGYDCVPAGGEKHACTPSPGTENELTERSGGCAVTGEDAGSARWLLLVFALPLLILFRRRRR
jgi:MYXO-CTERM domain-containing protein